MSKIAHYQDLIQEKRKKTPFREFIKELGSWEGLNLYKRNGRICRYPESNRISKLDDAEYLLASDYFMEYVAGKSFFQNFQELIQIFPYEYIFHFENCENSDFADGIFGAKNTYLSFIVGFNAENVAYSALCYNNIHNVYNSFLACINSSNIYMSGGVTESHNIFYSRYITNSANVWFSTNLIGCQECIGCDNLENQKYMIGNIQHTEGEYRAKKEKILKDKSSFQENYDRIRQRKGRNFASQNVEGDYIVKSSNIENGSWVINVHNARNLVVANGANGSSDFYDGFDVGMNSSHFYAVMGAGGTLQVSAHLYCSMQITDSSYIYHSQYLQNCHHCLGCIGLKNRSYCILNKQYTKEAWEILAEKIFASMEEDGTLGQFFPARVNPFYFNDTLAYLMDDTFTKEEIEGDGYLWRDEAIKVDIPEGVEVVRFNELGKFEGFDTERNWQIEPTIMEKVIIDDEGNYYKIIKMEYDFLMKHALPLPRLHWLERIKIGFSR